jgi:CHASE2 domain-containing sensor protein
MRRLRHACEALLALRVALVMLFGLVATSEFGPPLRLESLTLDARFRLRQAQPKPSPVVIVEALSD